LKVSCFEIMNLLAGINVCSIFDIKGKKKEILLPSHFPKKMQHFKFAGGPLETD
jgi:hypothetical protein